MRQQRLRQRQGRRSGGEGKDGRIGPNLGVCLRGLRMGQGYTLRGLADTSGVALNTLSLIENGRVSPSVSTLQRVAITLGVPITAFFETKSHETDTAYLRAAERASVAFAHGSLEDLGAGMADRTIEPFVIALNPHADSGPTPIVHTGQEFVYCLDGRIDYFIEGKPHTLEAGDSLLFEAHRPHRWSNPRADPSTAILVLCPPGGRNRPAARHFGTSSVE